jgi:hypothetical protein
VISVHCQLCCSLPKWYARARALIPFHTVVTYADERGHGYSYHYDAFDTSHGGEGASVAGEMQSGNRMVSALGYLSSHNAEEGGETEFPRLHLSVSRASILYHTKPSRRARVSIGHSADLYNYACCTNQSPVADFATSRSLGGFQ